jgi:hypothetical protein
MSLGRASSRALRPPMGNLGNHAHPQHIINGSSPRDSRRLRPRRDLRVTTNTSARTVAEWDEGGLLTSAETLGTPSLRHECTSSMGLPREIPAGSGPVVICGHTFKAGDVLSVPLVSLSTHFVGLVGAGLLWDFLDHGVRGNFNVLGDPQHIINGSSPRDSRRLRPRRDLRPHLQSRRRPLSNNEQFHLSDVTTNTSARTVAEWDEGGLLTSAETLGTPYA